MKKVFLVALTIWSTFSFGQTKFNPDSVNYHFMRIVNEYRNANGLSNLTLNYNLKVFADNHAKYLAENHDKKIVHSIQPIANGDRTAFRKILDNMFGSQSYFIENCANSPILEKNSFSNVNHEHQDLRQNYLRMLIDGPDNYLLANTAFLMWKHSPAHNDAMLSNDINNFYLAFSNYKSVYFFEFVALN